MERNKVDGTVHCQGNKQKKTKQKMARGERQKTVKVMGSKAVWVRRGLPEVKWSRKQEYGTLYEEAERRSGTGRLQGGREALVRQSSAATALRSLRSPGPLPTTLGTDSIHAELTPSPLKERCKHFNCLLLTKIHV